MGYLSSLRPRLYEFYLNYGVLLRPLGNVVYLLPPYVITPGELNFAYDVIQDSLALLPGLEEGTRARKFSTGTGL